MRGFEKFLDEVRKDEAAGLYLKKRIARRKLREENPEEFREYQLRLHAIRQSEYMKRCRAKKGLSNAYEQVTPIQSEAASEGGNANKANDRTRRTRGA